MGQAPPYARRHAGADVSDPPGRQKDTLLMNPDLRRPGALFSASICVHLWPLLSCRVPALAAALVLTLAGCTSAPPALKEDPDLQRLEAVSSRRPDVRVGVPPLVAAYPRERDAASAEADPSWWPARIGPEWRTRLVGAVREHAPFGRVEEVEREEGTPPSEMLRAALERGDRLLLELVIEDARYEFRGRNGWFGPSMALWLLLWFPSLFVADEDFGGVVRGRLGVRDVASEERVADVRIEASVVVPLDDFDRGFDLFGFLTAPSNLDAEHWEKVTEHVAPALEVELQRQVLIALHRHAVPELDRLPATTFAVVAASGGAGATRDGERLVAALTASGRVPSKNVVRLDGDAATPGALRAALEAAGRRAREQDTVLLCFSGTGTRGPEGPVLALGSGEPGGVTFAGIGQALGESAARRLVVLVDASVSGREGDERSLAATGASGPVDPAVLLQRALPDRDVYVLLGAGHDGPARETDGGGAFSLSLYRALAGAADDDRDGTITLAEVAAFATRDLADRAPEGAAPQVPLLLVGPKSRPAGEGGWLPRFSSSLLGTGTSR